MHPKVNGRDGPERVRFNDNDKSTETKISKDGLQVSTHYSSASPDDSSSLHHDFVGLQCSTAHLLVGHDGISPKQCQSHVGLLVLRGDSAHRKSVPDRLVLKEYQIHAIRRYFIALYPSGIMIVVNIRN